jgi:guanine deaminase
MITAKQKRYMQMAIDLSEQSLDSKKGGPFGAVIVREDKILGASGNRVYSENDPCAHAEIMAIRDACQNISSSDLSGAVIYSSGEPCPMCMAAIYWSKISEVYFSNTETESLEYGFWDKVILDELKKPKNKRKIKSIRIKNAGAIRVFDKALKDH